MGIFDFGKREKKEYEDEVTDSLDLVKNSKHISKLEKEYLEERYNRLLEIEEELKRLESIEKDYKKAIEEMQVLKAIREGEAKLKEKQGVIAKMEELLKDKQIEQEPNGQQPEPAQAEEIKLEFRRAVI